MTLLHQLTSTEEPPRPTRPRDFEVVLHVGYPKTASSWLQETVFGDLDSGFEFLGRDKYGSRARTTDAFVNVNSFCDDAKRARSYFEEDLRRCAEGPAIPIISDECLCGNPLENVYSGRDIADRLHAAFPRARVLIGIREQKAIALSYYRQYLRSQGVFPIEVFLGRGDEPPGFAPVLRADFLEYDRVVDYYQGLFGRENVLVLPMETLKEDPVGYVRSILEFCECPGRIERPKDARYVAMSAVALEFRRWLNPLTLLNPVTPPPTTLRQRIVYRLADMIDRLAPKSWSAPLERRWKAAVAQRYGEMFRESNRRLAELTDIDLAALEYEL
jgi:hypothetical protein